MDADNYDLRSIPLTEEPSPEALAWGQTVRQGFHQSAATDEQMQRWWTHDRIADAVRLRAAYPASGSHLADGVPAGTFASYDQTINVGGGRLVTSDYITDITVLPSHRRRGLLRRLITVDLQEARDRAVPFASLTASEATIYGRFGFGVATRTQEVELRTARNALRLRTRQPERVEVADPSTLRPTYTDVFRRYHETTRGSHQRPNYWLDVITGEYDFEQSGPNRALRAAVHYGLDDAPDGYVVYRPAEEESPELRIFELVALNAAAELGLWQFIGDLDLIHKVIYRKFSPSSPLLYALEDSRQLKVTSDNDHVWLRILDVEAAMTQRGYHHDGAVTFEVTDPMGFAAGTYRVEVNDQRGHAERTDAAPDFAIDVEALATAYFGLTSPMTLVEAGRISGDRDAIIRFSTMLQTFRPPMNLASF